MIARQMTPFFSSLRYILFLQFRTFRIQFYGIPHSHYVLVRKIHLNAKDDIFKPAKYILFLYRKFAIYNFLIYSFSYSQFDTNQAPIPWTFATYLNLLQGKKQPFRDVVENRCFGKFAKNFLPLFNLHMHFLSVTWLPRSQLLATVEATASPTRC